MVNSFLCRYINAFFYLGNIISCYIEVVLYGGIVSSVVYRSAFNRSWSFRYEDIILFVVVLSSCGNAICGAIEIGR